MTKTREEILDELQGLEWDVLNAQGPVMLTEFNLKAAEATFDRDPGNFAKGKAFCEAEKAYRAAVDAHDAAELARDRLMKELKYL